MPKEFPRQIFFGRGQENDIVIPNPRVSETHLVIEMGESDKIYVKDLGSSNGTYINQERISEKSVLLYPGDQLKAADQEIDWQTLIHYKKDRLPETAPGEGIPKVLAPEQKPSKAFSRLSRFSYFLLLMGLIFFSLILYWYLHYIVLP